MPTEFAPTRQRFRFLCRLMEKPDAVPDPVQDELRAICNRRAAIRRELGVQSKPERIRAQWEAEGKDIRDWEGYRPWLFAEDTNEKETT